MTTYPISTRRKGYRGSKRKLLEDVLYFNRCSEKIEQHLNRLIEEKDQEIQMYVYGEIALDLGLKIDLVRDALSVAGGGYNGITIRKPGGRKLD